jgi:hypothetical protein
MTRGIRFLGHGYSGVLVFNEDGAAFNRRSGAVNNRAFDSAGGQRRLSIRQCGEDQYKNKNEKLDSYLLLTTPADSQLRHVVSPEI